MQDPARLFEDVCLAASLRHCQFMTQEPCCFNAFRIIAFPWDWLSSWALTWKVILSVFTTFHLRFGCRREQISPPAILLIKHPVLFSLNLFLLLIGRSSFPFWVGRQIQKLTFFTILWKLVQTQCSAHQSRFFIIKAPLLEFHASHSFPSTKAGSCKLKKNNKTLWLSDYSVYSAFKKLSHNFHRLLCFRLICSSLTKPHIESITGTWKAWESVG